VDTFLKSITAHNAFAWRDETFAPLLRPRAEWSMKREEELDRVRVWIREALNPASALAQLYRKLEPALDLERDIVASLPAFETTPSFGRLEAHYSLRMLWRTMLRRHAMAEARQVGWPLGAYENWVWRWWRRKDYALPRLLVGVLLGFFALGSSSGVVGAIYDLHCSQWWFIAPFGCVVCVFLLAVADVQRQVGRIPFGKIVWRAVTVVAVGAAYAGLGAVAMWWMAVARCYTASRYWAVAFTCAGVALLLGFVFQLFWQDRSIGEPL
jgi:hypothetical protein